MPVLDVVASRSADGKSVFVKAVNTDLERPLRVEIGVRGVRVSPDAVVESVVADSLSAANGFQTPDAVRVTRSAVAAGDTFSIELPRHSVSVITLTVAR